MNPLKTVSAIFIAMITLITGCAYNDPSAMPLSPPAVTNPAHASENGPETVPPPSSPVTGTEQSSSSAETGVAYGVIEAIEPLGGTFDGIGGSGIGIGAIIGGVVGGLIGQQVGGGSGKEAATMAGVVSGALLGQEIEKEIEKRKTQNKDGQKTDGYRIRVRLDNGGTQAVEQKITEDLHVGDRVYIRNNSVYRVYRNG